MSEPIDENEELPNYDIQNENPKDLRNKLVYLFTDYFYISKAMVEVIKLLPKDDKELNEIIAFKYKISPQNKFMKIFNFKKGRDSKLKILQKIYLKSKKLVEENPEDLIQIMENFLYRYLYLEELEYFKMNQPVSY